MNDIPNQLIQLLMDLISEAYSDAKEERCKLHDIEWSGGIEMPPVLGEAELRCDSVAGIALQYIEKGKVKDKNSAFNYLNEYSVYHSPTLITWLINEGNNHKEFSRYLHYIALLRFVLIDKLNKD